MITYYKTGDGYVGITNQSPKGLKGLVFVGKGSEKGIESISEQCYAINQLEKLEKIEARDVPDDWFAAIGLEKRPEPEPVLNMEPTYIPTYTPITIQFPGDSLRRRLRANPNTQEYKQALKEAIEGWIYLIIGFAVSWYIVNYIWK